MFKTCPFTTRKKTADSNTAARVVDGKLILSFPAAQNPIVWQVDLSEIKASHFEVNHVEKNNVYALNMIKDNNASAKANAKTTTKTSQKTTQIALFATQDAAAQALMDTADALVHAHGHLGGAAQNMPANAPVNTQGYGAHTAHTAPYGVPVKKQPNTLKTILLTLLTLIALFFVATYLMSRGAPYNQTTAASTGQSANTGAVNTAPLAAGVPLSADDFLRGQ